jgi:hypothetical protein
LLGGFLHPLLAHAGAALLMEEPYGPFEGAVPSVATFKRRQVIACSTHVRSGCQLEKVVDELNLSKKIISCHPSNSPLPDHVDCFVALKIMRPETKPFQSV